MTQKRSVKMAVPAPSDRPNVAGRQHAVSTGHYLATLAAMRVLDRGGNAVDAGCTASMALSVLQPDMVSFACVAPTLVYLAELDRVVSLAGLGYWPKNTDVARLVQEGGRHVPEGLLRTVMPAAPATYIEALRRYGTISFEEAATPAMALARDGFATYPLLASNIDYLEASFRRWPDNAAIFLARGRAPRTGELFVQKDLARTIARLIQAERDCRGDRDRKLRAVHDCFYRGPIAREIADYHARNGGFVTFEDLAGFEVPVESSLSVSYRGDYTVHSCDVWCQGIVLLETLKILEGYDLRRLGHNAPDYVHTVAEALNLAFADREAYVGDPAFVRVPTQALISPAYAERQRARIAPDRAFGRLPDPGDPERTGQVAAGGAEVSYAARHGGSRLSQDTIYACVVDRHGNAYSATTSDNSSETPIIPGTGLAISSRGCQSRLEPGHPAEVKPGKRPRLTPNPALAFRDGRLFMAFGTPGGDVQSQAMLQVLLNIVEHGMTVQQAVEAPRLSSSSFPNSFAPHAYHPGRLNLEENFRPEVIEEMRRRGHDVEVWPRYPAANGGVCAVHIDPETGLRHAGADPRREGYALAW
jgi:gamma-glutamyltranspeptidase / glutathione hydrolase